MAAGDIKLAYGPSSAIPVTALNGALVSSTTHIAGWESGAIDNATDLYSDYIVTAKLVVAASPTAGEVKLWLVAELEDASWPSVFDGTESVETLPNTITRDALCRLAANAVTDTTVSATYYLMCPSAAAIFSGTLPRKFVCFITHSTVAALATAGNAVYTKGVYATVAS